MTVLEAGSEVGGLARTYRYKDYSFDIGGHRFFTKLPAVQALWEEWMGDEFIRVPRLSRIHYDGRFFQYPLRAADALLGLGVGRTSRVLLSYLWSRFRQSAVEENFEQWVSNRFGSELYRIFFKTYTEKVWGIPCTEIRAEWAAQRIQGLSLSRAILSATPLQRRSSEIRTLIDEFLYPRLGPGQMWERCRDRVREHGGEVLIWTHGSRPSRPMAGGSWRDGPHRRRHAARRGGPFHLHACSLRSAVRALGDQAPPRVRAAAEGLSYRDFVARGAGRRRDRSVPGQLDLRPHSGRQRRPHPELQELERRHGAGRDEERAGHGVFLLQGRRHLVADRRGARSRSRVGSWTRWDSRTAPRSLDGKVLRVPKAYPIVRLRVPAARRRDPGVSRSLHEFSHDRPEWNAQVQQSGPFRCSRRC